MVAISRWKVAQEGGLYFWFWINRIFPKESLERFHQYLSMVGGQNLAGKTILDVGVMSEWRDLELR
jgi:hypothetical protein